MKDPQESLLVRLFSDPSGGNGIDDEKGAAQKRNPVFKIEPYKERVHF
jgi:hypothetical protein